MPHLRRALAALPSLAGVRLACSIHVEFKMVALLEGLAQKGAELFVTTCNPSTTRDDVVAYLRAEGLTMAAAHNMPADAWQGAVEAAIDWQPTHLCEMGGDLTVELHRRGVGSAPVVAGMEATGSGITRLRDLPLAYPVFNWDDLPIKEGLHNRHMVGLTTWQAFFQRTKLTLHGKRVLVVGYGLVGRGVADSARAYGGTVQIAERDPVRAHEAAFAGWPVVPLDAGLAEADVVVTATGVTRVIGPDQLTRLREGAFLINVGHHADEIDLAALAAYPCREVLPFVEAITLPQATIYLFAGGSMANLVAGLGDSLNAFDLTLAVMASGIGFMVAEGAGWKPGLHVLPRRAWVASIA
jgi:adenosylhomocysteinase